MNISKILSTFLLSTLSVATLNSCENRTVAKVTPNDIRVEKNVVPVEKRNVDLLFVIDTSGSMVEEQQSLLNNFPVFINELENIQGGLPNIHIGVISPDVGAGDSGACGPGQNGNLQAIPNQANFPELTGCTGLDGNDKFIVDEDVEGNEGQRRVNYQGSLEDTFRCIAALGTGGCGFEQPLEAISQALNPQNVANAGFLRDDAFLGIVVITDEDDCSAIPSQATALYGATGAGPESELGPQHSFRCFEQGVVCQPDPMTPAERRIAGPRQDCETRENSQFMNPVQGYVDELKALKDDPLDVFVATIAGPTERVEVGPFCDASETLIPGFVDLQNACSDVQVTDSCPQNVPAKAHPAIRLSEFSSSQSFPDRSSTQSICNQDLSGPLQEIADVLASAVGSPCLTNTPVDLNPDPNVESFDCNVFDVTDPRTPSERDVRVDSCSANGGELPCWQISSDMDCEANLRLDVCRGSADDESGCPQGDEIPVEDNTEVQSECFVNP